MINTLITSWWTLFVLVALLVYSAHVSVETKTAPAQIVLGLVSLAHLVVLWLCHTHPLESPPWAYRLLIWYTTLVLALWLIAILKYLSDAYIKKHKPEVPPFDFELAHVDDKLLYVALNHYAKIFIGYVRTNGSSVITLEQYKELLYMLHQSVRSGEYVNRHKALESLKTLLELNNKRDTTVEPKRLRLNP